MYFVHIELYFEIYRINNAIICNNDAVDLIRVTFHKSKEVLIVIVWKSCYVDR